MYPCETGRGWSFRADLYYRFNVFRWHCRHCAIGVKTLRCWQSTSPPVRGAIREGTAAAESGIPCPPAGARVAGKRPRVVNLMRRVLALIRSGNGSSAWRRSSHLRRSWCLPARE